MNKEKFLKAKKSFDEIYNEIVDRINKIVNLKTDSEGFVYSGYNWGYNGKTFQVEAFNYKCGYDEFYITITWEDIIDVDKYGEKLKKEKEEFLKKEREKEKREEAEKKRRKEEYEKNLYLELKEKYENN